MPDFINISSSNFLGGTNVHNLIKIAFVGAIAYKVFSK